MKKKPIDSDQSLINSPDSDNFFLSPRIQQPYQKLVTGLHEGKILFTLTGESGLGKTFLMKHITHGFGVNAQLIKIQRSNTEYGEFFDTIGKEAGVDLKNESTLAEKVACLTRYFRAQPEQHIIIEVDQAQEIKLDTLDIIFNWVKLINSEQDHSTYIQIVLIGLPSLDELLKKSGLQKLDKKTICQCKLKPLIDDEILDYINFYLNQSEESANLFEQDALKRIAFYSKGNPGLINKLCDLGMLTTSLNQNPNVTATEIDEVADNCLLTQIESPSPKHPETALGALLPKASKPNKSTTNRKMPDTLLTELLAGKHPLPLMNESELENKPLAHDRRTEEAKTLTEKPESLSTFSEPVTIRDDGAEKILVNKPDNLYILSEPVTIRRDEADKTLIDKSGRVSSLSEPVFTRRNQAGKTFTDKLDSIPKTATPRNSFIIGLGIGALLSIGGFLALSQGWLGNQNKVSSRLQSENNSVKPEQALQNIKIAKRSATSISGTPDMDLNKLQPLSGVPAQPAEQTAADEKQIPDSTTPDDLQIANKQVVNPTIPEPEKSDNLKPRIDKLLDQADQQLAKKRLMTPVEDSAWQTFKEILSLDPGNERALAGIDKISQTYVLWAREEIKKDNFQNAKHLFNKALDVSPGYKDALSGLTRLDKNNGALPKKSSSRGNDTPDKQQVLGTPDIFQLLNQAEQQLVKRQLISPVDDNARQTYQEILSLDPGNKQALNGINKIRATFVLWAWEEIKKGNTQHAEYLFNKALEISPDDEDALSGLEWLINNNQENQQPPEPAEIKPEVRPKSW